MHHHICVQVVCFIYFQKKWNISFMFSSMKFISHNSFFFFFKVCQQIMMSCMNANINIRWRQINTGWLTNVILPGRREFCHLLFICWSAAHYAMIHSPTTRCLLQGEEQLKGDFRPVKRHTMRGLLTTPVPLSRCQQIKLFFLPLRKTFSLLSFACDNMRNWINELFQS